MSTPSGQGPQPPCEEHSTHIAGAPPGRKGGGTPTRRAGASRRPPVSRVGCVAIHAPTATSRYFRLKWHEPDGSRGDTTGGRTLQDAQAVAADIDRRVSRAASAQSVALLTDLAAEYLQAAVSPFDDQPWSASYKTQNTASLRRMLRIARHVRAMDVDRVLCDRLRAQGGTPTVVRQNTRVLRAFLRWGYQHPHRYFTAAQSDLLPHGTGMPRPALAGRSAPSRRRRGREVGSAATYVGSEDAPSPSRVLALSRSLQERAPRWGELAPELAANCGPRWGEQFQLCAPDVCLEGCTKFSRPHIHIDWQVNPGARVKHGENRRCLPKGDKRRVAPLPEVSFTGFALLEAVRQRCVEAERERAQGRNSEALLFPTSTGLMWWHSGFYSDVLLPALAEAGWPLLTWQARRSVWNEAAGSYDVVERPHLHAEQSWHSLRHRFARLAIDEYGADEGMLMALGGWENFQTVHQRYYRTGDDNTRAGLERFRGPGRTT